MGRNARLREERRKSKLDGTAKTKQEKQREKKARQALLQGQAISLVTGERVTVQIEL